MITSGECTEVCRKSVMSILHEAVPLFKLLDVRGAGEVRKHEFIEV
jgi:hypothetical protein